MNTQTAFGLIKGLAGRRLPLNTTNKGGVGNYIEDMLGIKPGSDTLDLTDGEIKSVPIVSGKVKETVAISMINIDNLLPDFMATKYYTKMKQVIFVPFVRDTTFVMFMNPLITSVDSILPQVIDDYNIIRTNTLKGDISGSDGVIIQSRTKGPGSRENPTRTTKSRAFYYRTWYLNAILNIERSQYNTPGYILSDMSGPFLKYAGSKSQLIDVIGQKITVQFDQYVEPFIGSASVLIGLINSGKITQATRVIIGDKNRALINLFKVIKTDPEDVINGVEKLLDGFSETKYYEHRARFNSIRGEIGSDNPNDNTQLNTELAILFLFLNITCYNGLFRSNQQGEFNVPVGKNAQNKPFCLTDTKKINIRKFSEILRTYNITMYSGDYTECIKYMNSIPTLFYFDPPYIPEKHTSFTSYMGDFNHEGFFQFVHEVSKSHNVLVSNSNTTLSACRLLPLKLTRVGVRRLIGSKTRDDCEEILADNFTKYETNIPDISEAELVEIMNKL